MKKLKKIVLLSGVLLSSSCIGPLEKGICHSQDGAICEGITTKSQCNKFSQDNKDGKKWKFIEGEESICPPPGPQPN